MSTKTATSIPTYEQCSREFGITVILNGTLTKGEKKTTLAPNVVRGYNNGSHESHMGYTIVNIYSSSGVGAMLIGGPCKQANIHLFGIANTSQTTTLVNVFGVVGHITTITAASFEIDKTFSEDTNIICQTILYPV